MACMSSFKEPLLKSYRLFNGLYDSTLPEESGPRQEKQGNFFQENIESKGFFDSAMRIRGVRRKKAGL